MSRARIGCCVGIGLLVAAGLLLAQDGSGGPGRRGGPPGGMRGPGGGRFGPQGAGGLSMSKPPTARNEAEKKILAVLAELNRSGGRGMMNVPEEDGRLLRLLAETTGAKRIVEIGTSNGYSGIWQCLALKATGGKLTTFEIDATRAALARENFKKAGVDDIVTLVEGDAHEKVTQMEGPIDMCFIDADKEGYTDYLTKLLPKVRPGGLIVAHNINPSMADPKYMEAITTNPDLETVFYTQAGGVSVTMKKRGWE
jgi:caffeoyl-CoA O-methyltransferase